MADGSIKGVVQKYPLFSSFPFLLLLVNVQEYRGYHNKAEVVWIKKLRVKKSELTHFDEFAKESISDLGTFFSRPICLRRSYRIKSFEKYYTPSEFISQLSLRNKASRHKSTKQGFCACHRLTPLKLSYCFYKLNCSIANGQIEAGVCPIVDIFHL